MYRFSSIVAVDVVAGRWGTLCARTITIIIFYKFITTCVNIVLNRLARLFFLSTFFFSGFLCGARSTSTTVSELYRFISRFHWKQWKKCISLFFRTGEVTQNYIIGGRVDKRMIKLKYCAVMFQFKKSICNRPGRLFFVNLSNGFSLKSDQKNHLFDKKTNFIPIYF